MKNTENGKKQELQLPVSLRDWFAGMVAVGLAEHMLHEELARNAYKYADAMIAERDRGEI